MDGELLPISLQSQSACWKRILTTSIDIDWRIGAFLQSPGL